MKNSLKWREIELADSKWLKAKFKEDGFEFEMTGKSKQPSSN